MNYLQSIAERIKSGVPVEVLPSVPNTDLLFNLYAVLLLAKGNEVSMEDVHNAWAAWMCQENPSHDAIKPFVELDEKAQQQDKPFVEAITKAAQDMASETSWYTR